MANPASPWNASHSYVPLCATTDGPVGGLSATGPARRVLIRLPDLSAVIANQPAVAPVGLLGEKASLDVAPAASAPYSPSDLAQFESIGVDARRDDKSSQLTEQLEHATLRAALVRMFVAHLSQLARHPRTLAAGLLVAVAQFFLLMLVNGRLTISEPTPAGAAAMQNQVAGGDWLPPALAPAAAEAPKWTAVTTTDHDPASASPIGDADPASLPAAPGTDTPAVEAPAAEPAATPSAPATDSLPSASTSAPQRLTIEQANALMASRPKPPGTTTAIPTHTPGVARLRGQIAPHGYLREPLTSAAQGTQQ